MVKDIGKNQFKDLDEATEYFKEVYEGLPPEVIKTVIEYCVRNPDKLPPNADKIDLKKEPTVKKEKEVIIEGAVELFEDPNDPSIKVIKHRDGACLLSAEEAEELQAKINEELAKQKEEERENNNRIWRERNRKLLKDKLLESKAKYGRLAKK
jgi:hypothetical protein